MKETQRPFQPVVPAADLGNEGLSVAGQPAVPAGTDCGASEAVESPAPVEALVAELEAEYRRAADKAIAAFRPEYPRNFHRLCRKARGIWRRLQWARRSSATGGNEKLSHTAPTTT